jgi:large subunit ribosomal protein L10
MAQGPMSLGSMPPPARVASTRAGKTALIGEVRGKFDRSTSAVFLNYKGMTVETATKLRANFRKAGVEYKIVKNTLVRQALKDLTYAKQLDDVLTGMTGIAWSYEDPSAAAKVVKAFRKEEGEAGEKLQIKAGLVEGSVLDAKAVEDQLATMPGKDELRAKLLATFQAPLQNFVMLLNAPAQNFVYLLSAKERQAGEAK